MATAVGGGSRHTLLVPMGARNHACPAYRTGRRQAGKRISVTTRLGLHGIGSLGVVTEPEDVAGMFVVRNVDADTWQLVRSVYHAFRQTVHILFKYGLDLRKGEKRVMSEFAERFRRLNLMILGIEPGDAETFRAGVQGDAAKALVQTSPMPRRPSKVVVKTQLTALARGVDRRGRLNLPASMARTVAGHGAAVERLEREIMRIDPHIAKRQRALLSMIHIAELHLGAVEHFIRQLLLYDGLKPIYHPRRRIVIARHCQYYAGDLERLDFHPYRNACRETAADLREVYATLSEWPPSKPNTLRIRTALGRCKNALAILHQVVALERVIYDMTRVEVGKPPRAPLVRWRTQCEAIHAALGRIDDRSFRRPVSLAAQKQLFRALPMFEKDDAQSQRDARNILKEASSILSGLEPPD